MIAKQLLPIALQTHVGLQWFKKLPANESIFLINEVANDI